MQGPNAIGWNLRHRHQVTVSAATIARYLARAGLVTPASRKRPRSSYIWFRVEADPLARQLMQLTLASLRVA